jgi:hypothetical protein
MNLVPFEAWPLEHHARWLHAGNAFGAHLVQVREAALATIPSEATAEERARINKAVDTALCGVMALLDGYPRTDLGSKYHAVYALIARMCPKGSMKPVEEIELAPNGDGLQMGFWGWVKGDFGPHSAAERVA